MQGWSLIGLTFLTCVFLAPIVVVTGFFAVEICAGLRPLRSSPHADAAGIAAVIVIPAHDEEAVIERTVRQTAREAGPNIDVLVVADNCTDRSAELARSLGAT